MTNQVAEATVLRWLDVTDAGLADEIRAHAFGVTIEDRRAFKWRVLRERLGVERDPRDVTPLDSWVRAMCEENGIEYRPPVFAIGVAVEESAGASRFTWWLA